MAHKDNRSTALSCYLFHFPEAFFLKFAISDCQDLIDDQDVRFQMGCDGEGQAHIHSGGVMLYRRIEELFDSGKRHDLIELLPRLRSVHAKYGAVKKDI